MILFISFEVDSKLHRIYNYESYVEEEESGRDSLCHVIEVFLFYSLYFWEAHNVDDF